MSQKYYQKTCKKAKNYLELNLRNLFFVCFFQAYIYETCMFFWIIWKSLISTSLMKYIISIHSQFYPDMYSGRTGSIASFSFRLLLAELPMHCNKPKEALTRLFNVLATIRQMLRNLGSGLREDGSPTEIKEADRQDSIRLWRGREVRTMHSVVNCALALKDYTLAMDVMGQLCERYVGQTCSFCLGSKLY